MSDNKLAFINGIILTGEKDMEPLKGHTLFTEGDTAFRGTFRRRAYRRVDELPEGLKGFADSSSKG